MSYRVKGMTCDGCVRAVTRAIQARLPTVEVRVELGSGTVTLTGPADDEAVARAIDDAGFELVGRV